MCMFVRVCKTGKQILVITETSFINLWISILSFCCVRKEQQIIIIEVYIVCLKKMA